MFPPLLKAQYCITLLCSSLLFLLLLGCASQAPLVGSDPWQEVTVQLKTSDGATVVGADCQLANSESVSQVSSGKAVRLRRSTSDLFVKCSNGTSQVALAQVKSGVKSDPYQQGLVSRAIPVVGLFNAIANHDSGTYFEYPSTLNLILNKTYLFQGGRSKMALMPGIWGMLADKPSGEGVFFAEGQTYEDLTKNIDYIFDPKRHSRIRIVNENLVSYTLTKDRLCFPRKGLLSDQTGSERISHGGTWITSANKTLGMPVMQALPASFSEHLIRGGSPLTLEVGFGYSGATHSEQCSVAISFAPKINANYEVHFVRDYAKKECRVDVGELQGEGSNLSIMNVDLSSARECEPQK